MGAVTEKLTVLDRFDEKVKKIEDFVNNLNNFDQTLKNIDGWMKDAEKQLHEIKNNSDKMTPEDRVSYTMDLREDTADKVDVIRPISQLRKISFLRVTLFPRMPKTTRMSWRESGNMLKICTLDAQRNATTSLRMSSSGFNTRLVSRNLVPGLQLLRQGLLKA